MSRRDILREGSKLRDELIEQFNNSEITVGENVVIPEKLISDYVRKKTNTVTVEVKKVNKKTLIVEHTYGGTHSPVNTYKINKTDVVARNIRSIGANPIDKKHDTTRSVNFGLDSILFNLDVLGDKREGREIYKIKNIGIMDLNWNPFIYNKDGNKEYYQRDFCWSLEDKQLLIESIYRRIDCGKILIRKRSWKELELMAAKGETELSFNDLVDGKQRLNALREFIFGYFPDKYGNYYGDLSLEAQHEFVNHQLFSYSEMPENSKDEDVIFQFLKLNFTGVPQSKEHIDFVKDISNRL